MRPTSGQMFPASAVLLCGVEMGIPVVVRKPFRFQGRTVEAGDRLELTQTEYVQAYVAETVRLPVAGESASDAVPAPVRKRGRYKRRDLRADA